LEKTKETKKKEEHKKTKTKKKPNTERGRGERHACTHTQDRNFRAQSFKDNMGF
jgi:hypothetical protein